MINKKQQTILGFIVLIVIAIAVINKNHIASVLRNAIEEESNLILPVEMYKQTEALGIQHIHSSRIDLHQSFKHLGPWLESIGASVSVVDYNNDGFYDLFFTNSTRGEPSFFYKNNGKEKFELIKENIGLNDVNADSGAIRSVFFDCDNDGWKDVLFTNRSCPLFYKNEKGKFKDITDKSNFECHNVYSVQVVDIDNDSYLDLILGAYSNFSELKSKFGYEIMPNNLNSANNGAPTIVYRNNGKCQFEKYDKLTFAAQWNQAIGLVDINNDEKTDLWFANDFNSDQLFLNRGDRYENYISSTMAHSHNRHGMSAEVGYFNSEYPHIFISHFNEPGENVEGNSIWTWDIKKNRPMDVSHDLRIRECGWAWGSKFIDFDNNGILDLLVTNGYISQNPKKSYWYSMTVLDNMTRNVLGDVRRWPKMGDASLGGYQKKCVFYNDGEKFHNTIDQTEMKDDLWDGRGVAAIDINNNGLQSAVVTYQKQSPQVYSFRSKPDSTQKIENNKWIGFKLIGTKSNRDAIGAHITIRTKDKIFKKIHAPFNGFVSQSDERVHFGLGTEPSAIEEITVLWPNGKKQKLDPNLTLNSYHIITEEVQ